MPLDAVPRLLGRPRSIENRTLQNHQWTHMLYAGVDVLARDNAIVALNLPQLAGVSLPASCGAPPGRPYSLPIGYVRQTYGPPSSSLVVNGLQYWLYNALGLLLTVPRYGGFVQGISVYPVGQYCNVAPVLVLFGGLLYTTGTTASCPFDPSDRER